MTRPAKPSGKLIGRRARSSSISDAKTLDMTLAPEAPTPGPSAPGEDRTSDARPAGVEAEFAAPERLGPYRVEGEIARGGMGIVLRGHHEELHRDVAIKLLRPEVSEDEVALERFLREARATARLRHPGIVAIHDVTRDEAGNPYLVMDFVAGESLRERLKRDRALPPGEAAQVIAAVAGAVAHAHEHKVLHRDLKPDNVLLDERGTPHLTDFGLAKVFRPEGAASETRASGRRPRSGALDLTLDGDVMGTPLYMAPEQVQDERDAIGPATDVWALGAMLYECLTGRPPFKADNLLGLFKQILSDEPTPPTRLNPLIPAALERLCLACLVKDPAQRLGSADELARELKRALERLARPVVLRAAPLPAGGGALVARALSAAVLCALCAGAGWWVLRGSPPRAGLAQGGARGASSPSAAAPRASASAATPAARPSASPLRSPRAPRATPAARLARVRASRTRLSPPLGPEAKTRRGVKLLARGEREPGLKLLREAAAGGHTPAHVQLGLAFVEGRGVDLDREAGLEWWRAGAAAGNGECALLAGALLMRAAEVDKRLEARTLLQQAHDAGALGDHPQAPQVLAALGDAWCAISPTDRAKGEDYLSRAAQLGEASAMVRLAWIYLQGERAPEALPLLERAAGLEDADALFALGEVYSRALAGVERDLERARGYYAEAAGRRHPHAQRRLEETRE